MFCIKCGVNAIKDNYCKEHFLEKHNLFSINNIKIKLCECGAFYHKNWSRGDFVHIILPKEIKSDYEIAKISLRSKLVGNRVYVDVECSGKIKGILKKETKHAIIFLKKQKCDRCVKLSGNYYEAVIQIRGSNSDKLLNIMKNFSDAVSSVQEVHGGYDVKFIQKSPALTAVKILQEQGYSIIKSYKHAATKKGMMLYRNYYSVR